jgi:hypothetical protein
MLAQELARSVEPGFDRLGADLKLRRRLLEAHLLNVAQNENKPEGIGQLVHGSFQQAAHLSPGRRCLRITHGGHPREHDNTSLIRNGIEHIEFIGRTQAPQPSQSFVQHG